MLKITIERDEATTLELEGKISGPWVEELERCWRSELERTPPSSVDVSLRSISFVDARGKALLARMVEAGTRVEGAGCMTRALIEEIVRTVRGWAAGQGGTQKKTLALFFLLSTIVGATSLLAQDQKPAPRIETPGVRLTLQEAVRLALKQNPQTQIAALALAQSQQEKNIALSALLPQGQLVVSDSAVRGNVETAFGRPIPGFSQVIGPFQIFNAGTQFSTPIFDLALWRRWQAAKEGVSASDAARQSVREQVVLLVVSQYLGCLRADAEVRAAQSRVNLAQVLYNQALDLQTHGVGTGIDTLRANVELQNEKQRLINAETARKTSLYGLSRLLNADPRQIIELGDSLSFFDTPASEAEGSLEQAYAARPEMRVLLAQERLAADLKRAASDSRLPTMNFQGFWSYQGTSITTGIPVYNYQVGFNVPLFTGGRIHAEIARADLETQKIAQQRTDLRNQIALEVKTAVAQLDSARHEVDVANLGVQLAQEEVAQARDRFQAGVANNIEVVSAQDALARANDNQIAALYRYNQARADLARSVGRIESLYAK